MTSGQISHSCSNRDDNVTDTRFILNPVSTLLGRLYADTEDAAEWPAGPRERGGLTFRACASRFSGNLHVDHTVH